MRIAVYIIGWLIVIEGLLFLLRPGLFGPIVRFFSTGIWIYVLSVIRVAFAVVFLLGAMQCRVEEIIIAFGILMLITGFAGLIVKRRIYGSIFHWCQERNLATVRFIAAIVMLVGAVIVYCA
jgi:hypothetical protein